MNYHDNAPWLSCVKKKMFLLKTIVVIYVTNIRRSATWIAFHSAAEPPQFLRRDSVS